MAMLPLRWIVTTRPAAGTDGAVEVLALEFELQLGVGREDDHVEREFFFGAAARIAVELAVDQLRHGRLCRRRSR